MKGIKKQLVISTLVSFASFILIEIIYRGSLSSFLSWLKTEPSGAFYLLFFLFLLHGALLIFNYRTFFLLTILINTIFCLLAFSSYTKEKLRGDPLLPTDLSMTSEAKNMLQYFANISTTSIIIIVIGIISFICLLIYGFRKIKNDKKSKRYYLLPALFVLLFGFFFYQDAYANSSVLYNSFNIQVNHYNQKENYQTNGVLLSFIRNIYYMHPTIPAGYSSTKIDSIIKQIPPDQPNNEDEKPNIIIIQSEAFWDPTLLKNVTFNKDPLPFFHQIYSNSTHGSLNVPVYGGGTVDTEFEVLTGMTNQFLPIGSVPYIQYIHNPLPALPNILRNQGYQSVAIHPYFNWFYQRETVLKDLGFDNFLSLEFFPQPMQDLYYYRDNEITDEIIKRLENNSDKPNFIYAITMQNHGPYPADRKKYYASMEAELNKSGDKFSPEAKNILEFQADNMVEVDKQLEKLITYLQNTKRKTIVAYFGDHLPLLGDNYLVYKEANYFKNDQTFDQYKKMFQTPLLIWNNYDNKKQSLNISAPFLGPYLLDQAGLKGYYLTDYLNQLQKDGKGFLPRLDYINHSQLTKSDMAKYQQLQYDIMFGSKYGLKKEKVNDKPSKTYRLGYADPHISSAEVTTYTTGEKVLLLKGNHFTTSSQVYVNGQAVGSIFKSPNVLYAFIPKGAKPADVVMKIFDNQNKLLAYSNHLTKIQK
ncbi:LTA synthase family protein [Bacillus sp. EB600]|uniref:LTA synthase family protein n=1 Tax=Bacillus sp. EB600 TaxID=2806345 RepID=UPI00210D3F41|nr:LTA synthase family protein [Bacillus sp. EB600]MCQ6278669.1 LTA synthase family protein [Bacillus sp. EB600]